MKVSQFGEKPKNKICCLCGTSIKGHGHNARPMGKGRCCKMKELKTLKDFDWINNEYNTIAQEDIINELKAEAVKRAKLYTEKANTKGLKDYEIKYWTARRIEVMEFNNLTEDDISVPQKQVQSEEDLPTEKEAGFTPLEWPCSVLYRRVN